MRSSSPSISPADSTAALGALQSPSRRTAVRLLRIVHERAHLFRDAMTKMRARRAEDKAKQALAAVDDEHLHDLSERGRELRRTALLERQAAACATVKKGRAYDW